jgi:ribonuclease HI/probable phosphoglycerate mutase
MDKQTAIKKLTDSLSDEVLEQIFPDTPAQHIRNLLLDKKDRNKTSPPVTAGAATQKTEHGDCHLYTDGASRGNPGLAGAGAVIFDDAGQELRAESEFLGQCTNNVAEYQALILGLQSAHDLGCPRLHIFLDSELIVRQMSGRYKVKNATLKPLFAEVQRLLKGLKGYTIAHVPRAKNKRADELANKGIDER